MCFQHLDKSASVSALHSTITVSIHHHLRLALGDRKGIGIQHVFLYVLITPPAKFVSPTLIAVGTAVVKNASEISVRVVNPVHLEHLGVLVYVVHQFSVYMGQNHDAH